MSESVTRHIVVDQKIVSSMNNCASLIGLTDQVLGELRAGHVTTRVEVKRLSPCTTMKMRDKHGV